MGGKEGKKRTRRRQNETKIFTIDDPVFVPVSTAAAAAAAVSSCFVFLCGLDLSRLVFRTPAGLRVVHDVDPACA